MSRYIGDICYKETGKPDDTGHKKAPAS